jgi:hypothetical protein
MGGIEPLEPLDRNRPEAHDRPRIERVGDLHRLRILVDFDAAVRHFGEGMAAIAEGRQQSRLGVQYRGGACRAPGLSGNLFSSWRIVRACPSAPSTLTEATW